MFGHFWERFRAFLQVLKIFDFFENFRRLDPPWHTGQKKIFEKLNPKHVQITFGHFRERFWAFLQFWKVFDFFENFRRLDSLSKKFFEKKHPKTCSTHVWTFLGTILGFSASFKNFEKFSTTRLFWKFSTTRLSKEHWAKKLFRKNRLKTCSTQRFWTLFGNDLGTFWFWGFLQFWKIFDFFENFRRLDPPWNTELDPPWQKNFFERKYPKTCSKHVWTFLGTILGFSAILKSFWFFWKFSTTRLSKEHWAKKLFRKNRLQTCSNHVWTLSGKILGIFAILKSFWFFWEFSKTRPTKEHWAKNFSKKNTPKHVQNTFGHFWERF